MKAYGGVNVLVHVSLTSALVWGRCTPGERAPLTHWIGGWVGPSTSLDDMEKWKFLPPLGLELRPLGRPVRSQSLYRLRYPGSQLDSWCMFEKLSNEIYYIKGFWRWSITQNYWVLGPCSSSCILKTRKHNVSETWSVSVLRWGEGRHLLCWVP
jgi:hypothetical protein